MTDQDLVLVALPGVQRFIAESRSTADVAAGSRLMSDLAQAMLSAVKRPVEIVLPQRDKAGSTPNRVVVLAPHGTGTELAQRMTQAVQTAWSAMVNELWRGDRSPPELPSARGFPDVQWVVVDSSVGDYAVQWSHGQQALATRKRTRTFSGLDERLIRQVCSLTGRWAAVDDTAAIQRRIRRRQGEGLSVPALVKRAHAGPGFPSTWSVASGPFKRELIEAAQGNDELRRRIGGLRTAVQAIQRLGVDFGSGRLPGLHHLAAVGDDPVLHWLVDVEGACVMPETWDGESLKRENGLDAAPDASAVDECATALRDLRTAVTDLEDREVRMPTAYLAVVVQDADRMGRSLGRPPPDRTDLRSWHQEVSATLVEAAAAQQAELESPDYLGKLVYAGGDDVLGFTSVRHAITAAAALNDAFRSKVAGSASRAGPMPGATASTAVVFFHASTPLQPALATARDLLNDVKRVHRPCFGVVVLRRGGERVRAIRPYLAGPPLPEGTSALDALTKLVDAMSNGLSGRLATDLERLEHEMTKVGALSLDGRRRELRRLALRHGADWDLAVESADVLLALGAAETVSRSHAALTSAARWAAVARFIHSEAQS